jgi:hypothetical protein
LSCCVYLGAGMLSARCEHRREREPLTSRQNHLHHAVPNIMVAFFTTMLHGGGALTNGQNHLHHTAPHRGGVLHNHVRRGGRGPLASGQNHLHHTAPHRGGVLHNHVRGGGPVASGQNHLHHTAPHSGGVLHNHVRGGGQWPVDRTIFITLLHTVVVLFTTMLEGGGGLGERTTDQSPEPSSSHCSTHHGGVLHTHGRRGGTIC